MGLGSLIGFGLLGAVLVPLLIATVVVNLITKKLLPGEIGNVTFKRNVSRIVGLFSCVAAFLLLTTLKAFMPYMIAVAVALLAPPVALTFLLLKLRKISSTIMENKALEIGARSATLLLAIFLLPGLGFAALSITDMFKGQECENGHLAEIEICKEDGEDGWMNSGGYYLWAQGPVSKEFCSKNLLWPETIEYPIFSGQEVGKFKKQDCTHITGDESQICYTYSRVASNFNTVYFFSIVSDSTCKRGMYFSGSQYALIDGNPTPLGYEGRDPEYVPGSLTENEP